MKELRKKIRAMLAAKERAKAQYAKADRLLDELVKMAAPGDVIDLGKGKLVKVVDNFADGKNLAWGHGSVRRFDLKVL